ncbi:sterol carrier family protein [Aestuariimicrobium soli]|uniref:sterol carrier family protein n=1 Tax=Aestuariimicrobium soli TaxID=2035834 RepID=UPI003EBBAF47
MTIVAAKQDQALRRVIAAFTATLEALVPASPGPSESPVNERDLRDRAGRAMVLLTDALQTLAAPTTTRPEGWAAHLAHRERAEQTLTEVARSVLGKDSAAALAQQARRLLADLRTELDQQRLPTAVDTLFGVARLVDYLRGALVDAVAVALRHGCTPPVAALTETTRALTMALGERHPGATLEVRVPPAAAVQLSALGEGPTHTRGTPPNVIELPVRLFTEVAVGLRAWTGDDVDRYASGAHVDAFARMLPVIDLGRRQRL